MRYIKYFFQYILILIFFLIFKILGPKKSSSLGGNLFEKIGPLFRSKIIINANMRTAFPNINSNDLNKTTRLMWNNYGRVFAEYVFIKDFRNGKLTSNIQIDGQEILDEIIKQNNQVVFISGHLSNFELMAMHLEKSGIKLCAIYRPLNNVFLNNIMERIRKKYICQYQIKKGLGGLRELISLKKQNFSTALMIDQRVSEGILSKFFNKEALTTTIPGQLVKKFNISVVALDMERIGDLEFKITINNPIHFSKEESIKNITDKLNLVLEEMIIKKPSQWIWSHNRWK